MVLVGSSVFTAGAILGERFRRPYVYFLFCPQLIPSGEHPSPILRSQALPRWANRASWALNEWIWSRLLKAMLTRARRE